MLVKPVDVILQFQLQLMKVVELHLVHELCFMTLEVASATALSKGQPFLLNERPIPKVFKSSSIICYLNSCYARILVEDIDNLSR